METLEAFRKGDGRLLPELFAVVVWTGPMMPRELAKSPHQGKGTISAAGRQGICAYLMAPVCRMMKRISVTRKAALAWRLVSRQVQRLCFLLGSTFLGEGGHKMCMRASAYGTSGIFSISISYMLDV